MVGFRRILSLIVACAVFSGGCPLGLYPGLDGAPSGTAPGGGGSVSTPSGGGASGGSGTAAQADQEFLNQLALEFPFCGETLDGQALREEILRLVNIEREREGLAAVEHDQTLENQATQYACEMIHYDFFAHENPVTGTDLRARTEEFGYEYFVIGENLAAGQASASQVMADWMASEGHRENILNPEFTELGVGVRTGGQYHIYWVQEFGKPRSP